MEKLILLLMLLFWTVAVCVDHCSATKCPTDWSEIANACVRFFKQPKLSWSSAEAECQKLDPGGHLFAPRTEEALDVLKEIGGEEKVHVGARRKDRRPQEIIWVDGNVLQGSWASGEPTANSGENCIAWSTGGFWDELCSKERSYMCEITPTALVVHAEPDFSDIEKWKLTDSRVESCVGIDTCSGHFVLKTSLLYPQGSNGVRVQLLQDGIACAQPTTQAYAMSVRWRNKDSPGGTPCVDYTRYENVFTCKYHCKCPDAVPCEIEFAVEFTGWFVLVPARVCSVSTTPVY